MLDDQGLADLIENEFDNEMSDNAEGKEVSLFVGMRIELATQREELRHIKEMLSEFRQEVRDLKTTYATKTDLEAIRADIKDLESWKTWTLRGILGLFLTAIGGILFVKGGVPHP